MTDAYLFIPDTAFFPLHQIIPASTSELTSHYMQGLLYFTLAVKACLSMQPRGVDFGLHHL